MFLYFYTFIFYSYLHDENNAFKPTLMVPYTKWWAYKKMTEEKLYTKILWKESYIEIEIELRW